MFSLATTVVAALIMITPVSIQNDNYLSIFSLNEGSKS